MKAHLIHILLKKHSILLALVLFNMACAPQRARFTAHSSQDAKNARTLDTTRPLKIVTPTGLTVLTDEAKNEVIAQAAALIEANTAQISVGDYRIYQRRNPVTKSLEKRRQTIVSVQDGSAEHETRSVDSGEQILKGKIPLNEFEPIRKGVRALSEEQYGEVYAIVAAAMTLQGVGTLPDESASVEIEVRAARFSPQDPSLFQLLLVSRISDGDAGQNEKKPRYHSLEVHISTTVPRPFDIVYLAYGKEKPTKVVMNSVGFGKL